MTFGRDSLQTVVLIGNTSLVGFFRDIIIEVMTAIASTKMKTKTNEEQNKMRKNLCTPKKRFMKKLTCPFGCKMVVGVVAQIANIARASRVATKFSLAICVLEFSYCNCIQYHRED